MEHKAIRCLVTIKVLNLTGLEINEIRQENYSSRNAFRILPEYCVKDNYSIGITEYWLQFGGEPKETYTLFDIEFCENPLREEIVHVGFDELVKDLTFKFIKHLPNVKTYEERDYLSLSDHLVFQLYYYGEEGELDINFIGYLDENKVLKFSM